MSEQTEKLQRWHEQRLRPFLREYLPDKVSSLDEALVRIQSLDRNVTEELPICFLGASGVGKSTLINALVAGQEIILPSGGIGPLTALAMQVRYGEKPAFDAQYHTAANLWRGIGFPLERGHAPALKTATGVNPEIVIPTDDEDYQSELDTMVEAEPVDAESSSPLETFRKQAQLLIKGNQDSPADLPYLIDSLREAAGMKRAWGTAGLLEDEECIRGIKHALALGKAAKSFHRELDSDTEAFRKELYEHASGYLAPLIKELHVQWKASLLETGIVLVDLPGVGGSR